MREIWLIKRKEIPLEGDNMMTYNEFYGMEFTTYKERKEKLNECRNRPGFYSLEFVTALGIGDAAIDLSKYRKSSICPYCKNTEFIKNGFSKSGIQRLKCKKCRKSIPVKTILQIGNSRISADVWFVFIQLVLIHEEKISRYKNGKHVSFLAKKWMEEVCTECGIDRKTGYHWKHRIINRLKEERLSFSKEDNNDWYDGFLKIFSKLYWNRNNEPEKYKWFIMSVLYCVA